MFEGVIIKETLADELLLDCLEIDKVEVQTKTANNFTYRFELTVILIVGNNGNAKSPKDKWFPGIK